MKPTLALAATLALSLFIGTAWAQSSPLVTAPMAAGSVGAAGLYDYAPPPPLSRARPSDTGVSGAMRFKWPSDQIGR